MKKTGAFNFTMTSVLLIGWLLFSVVYIVLDLWKGGLQLANRLGYEKAYVEVIQQSGKCEPFRIYAGEVAVDLINLKCLQQPEGEAGANAETELPPVAEVAQ